MTNNGKKSGSSSRQCYWNGDDHYVSMHPYIYFVQKWKKNKIKIVRKSDHDLPFALNYEINFTANTVGKLSYELLIWVE